MALLPFPHDAGEAIALARYWPLRCPLKWLTGLDCPLCGLGRSLIALAFGDWRQSWAYNPVGILMLLVLIPSLGLFLVNRPLFYRWQSNLTARWAHLSPRWKHALLGLYGLIFVLRNMKF